MCGIAAMIGRPSSRTFNMMENIFCSTITRGHDSSGVAVVRSNWEVPVIKDLVFPFELLRSAEYTEEVYDRHSEVVAMITHARASTVGKVDIDNAHPFQFGHITMVHNGTLKSDIKTEADQVGGTDSETICIGIAERGIDAVWKELEGAAALIWWDAKDRTLNLIRNYQRPLHFAGTANKSNVFIASEDWMIKYAAKQAGIALAESDKVVQPTAHTLVSLRMKKGKVVFRTRVLEEYKPPFQAQTWRNTYTTGTNGGKPATGVQLAKPIKSEPTKSAAQSALIFQNPPEDKGQWLRPDITKERYIALNYERCTFCGDSIKDEWDTAWVVDDDNAVCESCVLVAKVNNIPLDSNSVRGI